MKQGVWVVRIFQQNIVYRCVEIYANRGLIFDSYEVLK